MSLRLSAALARIACWVQASQPHWVRASWRRPTASERRLSSKARPWTSSSAAHRLAAAASARR
eukprot:8121988-Alexandrium_andersonii.AAC.1